MMKSSLHAEEDDFVPDLQRSIHPRERPDWEETLSAMVKLFKNVLLSVSFKMLLSGVGTLYMFLVYKLLHGFHYENSEKHSVTWQCYH